MPRGETICSSLFPSGFAFAFACPFGWLAATAGFGRELQWLQPAGIFISGSINPFRNNTAVKQNETDSFVAEFNRRQDGGFPKGRLKQKQP